MARQFIRHLFNKNHIEILKIDNPTFPIENIPTYQEVSTSNYNHYNSALRWKPREEKVVIKESKLGFYYKSKVVVPSKSETFSGGTTKVIITYPIPGEKDSYYQLSYYKRHGDNYIGNEDGLRPWDIYPGDKNFPDNMLEALIKEVNTFFDIAETCKSNGFYSKNSIWRVSKDRPYAVNSLRKTVFKDLFCNENGPRFQTDTEKILAHGFDPKYSFRKDKEKK